MNYLYELTVKNDRRIIPYIARFISESAVSLGLSEKKAKYLCFTVESVLEIRTSAIGENNPEIRLTAEDNGEYFKFSVTDFGRPYILTKNQQAILKRKLVDRYLFEQRGRKGQCFSAPHIYRKMKNIDLSGRAAQKDSGPLISASESPAGFS